jgi:hypothetical protein
MKSLAIFFFSLLTFNPVSPVNDQIHDILVIGKDIIYLKTFPLEELGFTQRPFKYGIYDFPSISCLRGYQATWKVIDKKLFLVSVNKINAPDEKLDLIKYFEDNDYSPRIIDGMIFADWYTKELASYPKDYKYWGCEWKSKTPKKLKTSIRFEKGIMVSNKYKSKHTKA